MNPNGPQPSDGGYSGGSDPSGWSGVASLLGGFYDTTIASQTARKNTDKTIEAQRYEAEKAYQRQVEMWHMQNAYNSPAEQMKRFGAAGLNPNLIYGQGNPGNANSTPQYQPPNLQYRYEAPAYGAASQQGLQTLMQVGSWMQNMRLSEQELNQKTTGAESASEMLNFLRSANPKKLQDMDNRLSTFPYQSALMRNLAEKSNVGITDMLEDFRLEWGRPIGELEFGTYDYKDFQYSGLKGNELLKKIAERKLAEAKSMWSEYGITDPQDMYTNILRAVGRMTGLGNPSFSPGKKPSFNSKARNAPTIGKGSMGRWSSRTRRWYPTTGR